MLPLPPLTKLLMLICVAVFCVTELLARYLPLNHWFGLWPVMSGNFLPWQLVSYAFLHGSVGHLFFNMLGLWMFGADLERLWDRKRFGQLLLASTVTAALTQLLITFLLGRFAVTVGASGALFGLLLAYALSFPRRLWDLVGFLPMALMMIPGEIFNTLGLVLFFLLLTNRQMVPIAPIMVSAKTMVLIFGGMELVQGVLFSHSGIAHFAHLGGMLGGWLMLRFWQGRPPFPPRLRRL
ncbi:MAG: rhomboid family intramembrane serine protease [Burkholderiales bacterium]|nr:rhomboid family intramembrane serine protease [Burkholderiales bacterium]